ncbi:MAG: holo-ACP synthase [Planctomyces sp.]|nr:holo-ACP synthase [Planctomyces sp.]
MRLEIGTDIVEIERIRGMMDRHRDHFIERCFTAAEIEYSRRHRDSAVRFAGRWAAKEAVVKVLGTGFVQGITFHDIEVVPLPSGQPSVVLTGGAKEIADRLGITSLKLTISHAREYATATAIGLCETQDGHS